MSAGKQYGLIKPKQASQPLKRPSVFDEDSDSNDAPDMSQTDWIKKSYQKEAQKNHQKRAVKTQLDKAMEEDPSVFQYDEVYDDMQSKKVETIKAKKDVEKKPRYIQALLAQAEKRKRENEYRNERLIQKEREAEGEMYKDKETFVTSAYRKKLEEFKKLDEAERRQDMLEVLVVKPSSVDKNDEEITLEDCEIAFEHYREELINVFERKPTDISELSEVSSQQACSTLDANLDTSSKNFLALSSATPREPAIEPARKKESTLKNCPLVDDKSAIQSKPQTRTHEVTPTEPPPGSLINEEPQKSKVPFTLQNVTHEISRTQDNIVKNEEERIIKRNKFLGSTQSSSSESELDLSCPVADPLAVLGPEESIEKKALKIGDVTKQKDLSGFYRHLYQSTVSSNNSKSAKDEAISPETKNSSRVSGSKSPEMEKEIEESFPLSKNPAKSRHYRKRKSSSSSSSSNEEEAKKRNATRKKASGSKSANSGPANPDADTDISSSSSSSGSSSSSSSSSSESDSESAKVGGKKSNDVRLTSGSEEGEIIESDKKAEKKSSSKTNSVPDEKPRTKLDKTEKTAENVRKSSKSVEKENGAESNVKKVNDVDVENSEDKENQMEEVVKIDIWEKRTVGQVFDDALKRYLERKAARLASQNG
ncbi:unnamed protein product [Bemisia tabaci]|uniref:Nuclear speckle splicing regulatory protein 1 N-terminal domain-containing protein n=1 Tax=Bemisia tabaci TaxID=7038 RepID=A0A9P0F9F4_BEMTA|nr:unnamed protein product [Bemisia tabaci]